MSLSHSDIEILFKDNYKALCLLAYHYVQDVDEAEDIVQDIFSSLLCKKETTSIENLEGYIKVSIRNNSLKRLKNKRKSQSITTSDKEKLWEDCKDLSEEADSQIVNLKQKFYEELNTLPPQCRKIFLLCGLNGMKYKDTAAELDISINTVKTQMKKAYKLLRASFKHVYLFLAFFHSGKKI